MQMTNEEICRNYRQAAKPKEQIKILADLNQTTTSVIEEILESGGVKPRKKKQRPNTKWEPALVKDLERLFEEGLSVSEISERLGVDYKAVHYKLGALNLLRKRSKETESAAKVQQNGSAVVDNGAEKRYIKQLEDLLTKKTAAERKLQAEKDELTKAVESLVAENKELTDRVKTLRDRCRKYAEEIDVERSGELEDIFESLVGLVDCIRGINVDEMKDAGNTAYLLELIDVLFDKMQQRLPWVKKDTVSAGTDTVSDT